MVREEERLAKAQLGKQVAECGKHKQTEQQRQHQHQQHQRRLCRCDWASSAVGSRRQQQQQQRGMCNAEYVSLSADTLPLSPPPGCLQCAFSLLSRPAWRHHPHAGCVAHTLARTQRRRTLRPNASQTFTPVSTAGRSSFALPLTPTTVCLPRRPPGGTSGKSSVVSELLVETFYFLFCFVCLHPRRRLSCCGFVYIKIDKEDAK